MILVLELLGMRKQNHKNKKNTNIIFLILVAITLIGTGLFAAEKEGNIEGFIDFIGNTKNSKKQTNKNKKVGKTPNTFIPTEVVSADQAVAFPTDI